LGIFLVSHNEQEDRRIRRLQARTSNENDDEHDRLVRFIDRKLS